MKKFTFIIVSLLTLIACTQREEETILPDGHIITFSLLNSAGNETERISNRAQGDENYNENRIDHMDIFFFDADGNCVYYPSSPQIQETNLNIIVSIPEDIANTIFNNNIKLYILTNSNISREDLTGKTFSAIQKLIYHNAKTFNPSDNTIQNSFLMDGLLDINIPSSSVNHLGTITLKRAASKISIRITDATVNGYTPLEASIQMHNYLDKTAIGSEASPYLPEINDYKHSAFRDIWIPNSGTSGFETIPFYSYANDWEFDASRESYVLLAVTWLKEGESTPQKYYYRIPFNYRSASSDNQHRLHRNYIYEFDVIINRLGKKDPEEPVELNPNFRIKDWTTKDIEIKLDQYDYLFVSEKNIVIHNIPNKEIHYTSSKPISIKDIRAYYNQYLYSGDINVIDYLPGDKNYPVFDIDEQRNIITLTSPVPINYVPVTISFTVQNEANLSQAIKVVQYPRQYLTSEYSNGVPLNDPPFGEWTNSGQGLPGRTNFNLYTITTTALSPDDPFKVGGDIMTDIYDLFYEKNIPVTKMDEASNNIISPQFIIASQRGITSTNTSYTSAQRRCLTYAEDKYPKGTWRMPTQAEMLLISKLQRDGNSALKDLFTPVGNATDWWVARMEEFSGGKFYYSVTMTTGKLNKYKYEYGGTLPAFSVRCVHDTWKD